jgi:hypothetical protein
MDSERGLVQRTTYASASRQPIDGVLLPGFNQAANTMPYHRETIMGDLEVGREAISHVGNDTPDLYIPGPQTSSNRQTGNGQIAMPSASPSQMTDLHAAQAAQRAARQAEQANRHIEQARRYAARDAEYAKRDARRDDHEAEPVTNDSHSRPSPTTHGSAVPRSGSSRPQGPSRPGAKSLLGIDVKHEYFNHAFGRGDLYDVRQSPGGGIQWDEARSTAAYLGKFRRNPTTGEMVSLVSPGRV